MQPARKRRGTVTGCSRALVVNLLPKMHATSFRQVRSRGPLSRDVVSRVHPLSAFSETVDATSIGARTRARKGRSCRGMGIQLDRDE